MSKSLNELIHRYLVGIATDEEVRELEARLLADDQLQDEFLFQTELDAHLRQEAQSGSSLDPALSHRVEVPPAAMRAATLFGSAFPVSPAGCHGSADALHLRCPHHPRSGGSALVGEVPDRRIVDRAEYLGRCCNG